LASGGSLATTGIYLIDDFSVVPEPSTIALLCGLLGVSGLGRRRKIAR
jgi:PEP-CTERM motif